MIWQKESNILSMDIVCMYSGTAKSQKSLNNINHCQKLFSVHWGNEKPDRLPEEHSSCVLQQWVSLLSHGIHQKNAVAGLPMHQHHCIVAPDCDMQKQTLHEQDLPLSANLLNKTFKEE